MDSLDAAEAALGAGKTVEALEALLELWRQTRSPAIAGVIDALTALLGRSLAPIQGKTRKAFHERWLDLANARRACDVGRLMDAWSRQPWSQLRERVERLALLPDDPRIALPLAQFVQAMPTTTSAGDACWNAIFRQLIRIGDVRCVGPLEVRQATPSPGGLFYEDLPPKLTKVLLALAEVQPAPVDEGRLNALRMKIAELDQQPAPTEAAILLASPSAAEAPNEAELLARIYAQPEDDAPRLIYADFLAERGDPLGEFIALQFKPKPTGVETKRMRALLRQHGRTWLREIEPAVMPKSEEFSRGFLSFCRFDFRTAAQRAELGRHPAWNTVTRLAVWDAAPKREHEFLLEHELRGLELLEVAISAELAAKMAVRTPPYRRLQKLKVAVLEAQKAHLATVAAAASFPRLTGLGLSGYGLREPQPQPYESFRWLWESPLGARLEWLGVEQLQINLLEWLPRLERHPVLKQLDLGMWPPISFSKQTDGWAAQLKSVWHGNTAALAHVDTLRATVRRVELGPVIPGEAASREALKRALSGLEIVEARA